MASAARKVRLKSAAQHVYAGRLVRCNDIFEATQTDADDLIALHFAVLADDEPPRQKRAYRRRDLKAEN